MYHRPTIIYVCLFLYCYVFHCIPLLFDMYCNKVMIKKIRCDENSSHRRLSTVISRTVHYAQIRLLDVYTCGIDLLHVLT